MVDVEIQFLARWGHIAFGIAWIGLLYYFNFVQGGYMAAASAEAKVDAFTKLVPSALWWFRWAALLTFLTGLLLLGFVMVTGQLSSDILVGVVMATLMLINVWFIIWPNQRIVIASNEAVAAGGEPDPNQGAAAGKALLASRTNTLLSLPMLFFMTSSAHNKLGVAWNEGTTELIVALLIVLAIELNAIFGKMGPITTVRGVITSSLALTAIMWLLMVWL